KCWAGVYVDSTSKSVLHLAKGGGAFFSPGTAAGSHGNELRWKAKEDFLYIIDSDNNPFSWPGAASYLRRDPVQAGKLAGFRLEVRTSNGTALVESSHLNRDSLGFLYPGCTYVLSWRPGLPFRAGNARENRVVVNRDGTITDAENGRRVARWSFPEATPVVDGVDDTWATGDEVVLLLDGEYLQPYRSGSGHEDMPEQFEALIVISRAVPRPTKANEDLSCVINGIPSRASWLSWSMILCSTAHIKRETTLYIAFRGRRFSLAATFQRAPPPRHIRLAWPQSEAFDALLPKPAPTSSWPGPSSSSSHQSAPGVPTGAPFGSSMVICTMFKNEAPYLEEWLQYHRLLGVSK
ncbi:unnamed protein product, partial [Ectocarpus sp. 12 AP-2014]